MIFRLSQKLSKKIVPGALSTLPLDENPYADWSCHLFTADRKQYVILSNTKSLYSCVMSGRGITSSSGFTQRALSTIREFMQEDGQQFVYERFIVPAISDVKFGKALNRRVTGSMNELIGVAQSRLVETSATPQELGFALNDIWLSALATEQSHGSYDKPKESFKRLAGDRVEAKEAEEDA